MNQEVLQRYLLSDDMTLKVRASVEEFIETQKSNQESVGEFSKHYLSEEELQVIVTSINANLTSQVHTKLSDSEVGKNVAHIVVENIVDKMKARKITYKEKPIGFICTFDFEETPSVCYGIDKAYRNKGVMTETMKSVFYYQTQFSKKSFLFRISKENVASLSVHNKIASTFNTVLHIDSNNN